MFSKTALYVSILGLFSIKYSHAWELDQSCNAQQYSGMVTAGVAAGMSQAQDAYNALIRRPWGSVEGRDDDLINLAQWTMKEPGITPRSSLPRNGNGQPDFDRLTSNLDKVEAIFRGILDQASPGLSFAGTRANLQAKIYCDLSRFSYDQSRKKWYDSANPAFLDSIPCDDSDDMAETYILDDTDPSIIQICPKYLDKMVNYRNQNLEYLKGPLPYDNAIKKFFNTPMDTYSAFGNTLLHEFTHTFAAGDNEDVSTKRLFILGRGPYGWNNIVKKSADMAWKNGDNLAYFAMGVQMLRLRLIPQKDGKVVPAPPRLPPRGLSFNETVLLDV